VPNAPIINRPAHHAAQLHQPSRLTLSGLPATYVDPSEFLPTRAAAAAKAAAKIMEAQSVHENQGQKVLDELAQATSRLIQQVRMRFMRNPCNGPALTLAARYMTFSHNAGEQETAFSNAASGTNAEFLFGLDKHELPPILCDGICCLFFQQGMPLPLPPHTPLHAENQRVANTRSRFRRRGAIMCMVMCMVGTGKAHTL
jgi:hypothetical protein